MVYSAKSDNTNTISQFTRRKNVTITTGGTSTPANYQVKLDITYESEMQADFDDIRFNTKSRAYIDYWIESYVASTSAVVWIELPNAITDPGSDTIFMFYGNSGLSNGSVGADTFIQWHGASSADFLDALIIPPNPTIYESKFRATVSPHNVLCGLANTAGLDDDRMSFQSFVQNNLRYFGSSNEGVPTSISESPDLSINIWHRIKITNDGTNAYAYVDNNEISAGGINTNLPDENLGLVMWEVQGNCEQEFSLARKYIANEPTLSYGTAQHQRRIPQFIG